MLNYPLLEIHPRLLELIDAERFTLEGLKGLLHVSVSRRRDIPPDEETLQTYVLEIRYRSRFVLYPVSVGALLPSGVLRPLLALVLSSMKVVSKGNFSLFWEYRKLQVSGEPLIYQQVWQEFELLVQKLKELRTVMRRREAILLESPLADLPPDDDDGGSKLVAPLKEQ